MNINKKKINEIAFININNYRENAKKKKLINWTSSKL